MRLNSAILLFLSLIFLESRSQSTLGSAFRLKEQDELRKLLAKEEAAVFFSGTWLPAHEGGSFLPSVDFRHLVGEEMVGAVFVLLKDSVEWEGKKANAFLFTPGADDFRRSGIGAAQPVPKSKWLELATADWGRFCGQVLAGPSVKKIHLKDEYLAEAGSNRALLVGEQVSTFFSKLAPGFPFTHEAAILYKEIQNTSDNNIGELQQKISSFFTFYGFPLTTDPILQRAMRANSHKELQELRNDLSVLKVDIVSLAGMMAKISQVKSPEEQVYVNNSNRLVISVFNSVTNNLTVGQNEAEVAAFATWKATAAGATLTQPVRVAASGARAWPRGDANLGNLSGGTTGASIPVTIEINLELDGYPGWICRTLPVGGAFKPVEAKVAKVLGEAHAELLDALKPGASVTQLVAQRASGNDKRLKAAGIYKSDAGPELAPLFHEVLVMDTHFSSEVLPEKLSAGMVLYVKSGIFFQGTKGIHPEYLDCSMELGDMVRITESGFELLTKL